MTAGRTVRSHSVNWCTPPQYVNAVQQVFGGVIELDPCSNQWSVVHAKKEFVLPTYDGLVEEWNYPTIYVNPPYGADRERKTTIKHWLCKCYNAYQSYASEIIALIPVATNTSHWKEYIWGRATAVCFLYETRLKFLENGSGEGQGAPMACAMIYWGRHYQRFFDVFLQFGAVIDLQELSGKQVGTIKSSKPSSISNSIKMSKRFYTNSRNYTRSFTI